MKNLVMGVAKSYSWDVLEPFVLSCKRNCPSAELVFFVDDISDFTRDRLIRHGVRLVDIPVEYKEILVVNSRFKLYTNFLEQFGANYVQVFLADTRDVIFQNDLFEKFSGLSNWLGCATEADDIGGSRTGDRCNYNWLVNCFGKETAERLADQKVICAGTIIGTVNEMKIFCRMMWEMVKTNPKDSFDQAIMNYLVWNNLLPIENLIELDVFSGEMFTAALVTDFDVRGEKILRGDGGIPAVVHQYDRQISLIELVDEIYHDKNFQADKRFTDIRDTIEQATSLLHANKIDAAARLFIGKFLVTEDFNNCVKVLLKLWEVAMSKPLTQVSGDIELAVQSALKTVNNFPPYEMDRICRFIKYSRRERHLVDDELADLLTKALIKSAQQTWAANELERYRFCIDMLEILGVDYRV